MQPIINSNLGSEENNSGQNPPHQDGFSLHQQSQSLPPVANDMLIPSPTMSPASTLQTNTQNISQNLQQPNLGNGQSAFGTNQSVQNTPVQNTPVQNTPVQNTPVQNTPVQPSASMQTIQRPINSQDFFANSPAFNNTDSHSIAKLPKKFNFLPWAIGGVVGIVLLLSVGIFATEKGAIHWNLDRYYTKTGIQKIWGGMPYDSKEALLVAQEAAGDNVSSHIVATAAVTVETTSGLSNPIVSFLDKYLTKTDQGKVAGVNSQNDQIASNDYEYAADTQQFVFSLKTEADIAKDSFDARITLDLSSLGSLLDTYGLIGQNQIAIDIKQVGENYFVRIPILSLLIGENNKWVKVSKGDLESLTGEDFNFQAETLKQYIGSITSGNKVGVEKLDGVLANKYYASFDVNKIFGNEAKEFGIENAQLSGNFWISQKDHYLRKSSLTIASTSSGIKATINLDLVLSDFGKEFSITAPSDQEIDKEGFVSIFNKISGEALGMSQANARDAQRKSDLRALKAALETYYSEKQSYPISNGGCKTSASDCAINELVPDYVVAIPADSDSARYYYYTSDGKSFEITATLDNQSDPAGTIVGSNNIYKVVND